jgi:hypothetical protein
VPAQHHDDGAMSARGVGHGAHHRTEVASDEDVGERLEEGAERAIVRRRLREVASADLVLTDRDGDGANGREIGLRRGGGTRV